MKVGYCYAVCDPLHNGHIEYFKRSKIYCDILICGILKDEALTIKPKPIIPFEQRYRIVESIKYIDLIVPQEEQSPFKNLMRYGIDILFESETHKDFNEDAIKHMDFMSKRIIYTGLYEGQSSTKIKEKIIDTHNS